MKVVFLAIAAVAVVAWSSSGDMLPWMFLLFIFTGGLFWALFDGRRKYLDSERALSLGSDTPSTETRRPLDWDLIDIDVAVTAIDIAEGVPHECGRCPVAKAFNRQLQPGHEVKIGTIGFDILSLGKLIYSDDAIPDSVHDFVMRFDAGWHVRPFVFTVSIPFCLAEESWQELWTEVEA